MIQKIALFTFISVVAMCCTKSRLEATSKKVFVQTKDIYHRGSLGDSIVATPENERWTIYMRGETEVDRNSYGLNYFIFSKAGKVIIQGSATIPWTAEYLCGLPYSHQIDLKTTTFNFAFRIVQLSNSDSHGLELYFLDTEERCRHQYYFEEKDV